MGFLDSKGVKKLVNWINNKINNINIPKTGQPEWTTASTTADFINLIEYQTCVCDGYCNFIEIRFDGSYLPDINREYKLQISGDSLNNVHWPSKFDMHWPNNEIPIFEENKRYEIYIAGGRIVSIDDITELEEEVTYIFNISSVTSFFVKSTDTSTTYNINGQEFSNIYNSFALSIGENIIKIKGDLFQLEFAEVDVLDYTLTLDCSKMKSNNFDKVTNGFKIDNIIYPEECHGYIDNPIYKFTIDSFSFNFLKNNILFKPTFSFKTNRLVISNNNIYVSESISFEDTQLTNIQVNEILRTIGIIGACIFNYACFAFKHKYYTIGTLDGYCYEIGANLSHYPIAMNCILTQDTQFDHSLSEECYINCAKYAFKFSSHEIFDNKIIFMFDADWENSIFEAHNGHLDIYYYEDIPQHIIDNAINCTFIKVDNIEDIPFKYLPLTSNDVKNYDENGNIID